MFTKTRTRRTMAVLAAVTVAMLVVPPTADAMTPPTGLPDAHVITTSSGVNYAFSTSTSEWSVVGVATASDYDLNLYQNNILLGTSAAPTGITDFIAINNHLRPLGTYKASVTHFSGADPYYVEQRQGHTESVMPVPDNDGVTGPSDPDLQFSWVHSQDVLSLSDMYLTAGEQIWVKTSNTWQFFYMLESNPADPSTFIRTRAQAGAIANTKMAQGCTLYTANYTGWHAILEINMDLPWVSNPQQGIADALDAFDPARPNTCPQRNFPDPTPAGP